MSMYTEDDDIPPKESRAEIFIAIAIVVIAGLLVWAYIYLSK